MNTRSLWSSRYSKLISAAALIAASGCATQSQQFAEAAFAPPGAASLRPTSRERAEVWLAESPRTLTLHVDQTLPRPQLRSHDYRADERMRKGAEKGLGTAAEVFVKACVGIPGVGCALGALESPVWFAWGAIEGASGVKSVDTYYSIDKAQGAPRLLRQSNKAIDVPALLEHDVIAAAKTSVRHSVYPDHANADGSRRPESDGELRLTLHTFGLSGEVGTDPRVGLSLRVQADLRAPDGWSASLGEFDYQSSSRPVSEWRAGNARLFRREIHEGISRIAAQIVNAMDTKPSMLTIAKVTDYRSHRASLSEVVMSAPAVAKGEPGRTDLPTTGASWRYAFSDRMYGRDTRTIAVSVVGVNDGRIREELFMDGAGAQKTVLRRLVDPASERFAVYRSSGDYVLTEFAPYLVAARGEGALYTVTDAEGYPEVGPPAWIISASALPRKKIEVPAGTFSARGLQIWGRPAIPSARPSALRAFSIRVWYAPEVKRYVKLEHKTWSGQGDANSDELVELLEYRPGTEAGVQASAKVDHSGAMARP